MKAVFTYIPVVHSGTLSFLQEYKGLPILLLDNEEGKLENPYLERDVRALSAHTVAEALRAHGVERVEVIAPRDLAERFAEFEKIIVPEDEILDFFLEKYVPEKSIERVNTFLRWTKQISTVEFEVPPDREVTEDTFAQELMNSLEKKAQKSSDWWRQIAAAIVKEGEVLVTAYNKHFPGPHALTINGDPRSNFDAGEAPGTYTSIHAEAWALAQCARSGIATEGASIYVTTFPCPTCARLLVEAGIKRVFYKKGYSVLDAEAVLKNAGIEITLVTE